MTILQRLQILSEEVMDAEDLDKLKQHVGELIMLLVLDRQEAGKVTMEEIER